MNKIEKRKEKLQQQTKEWQQQKPLVIAEQQLNIDKKETKERNKKKITTTKFLMFFLFTSCSVIEAFTLYVTLKTLDLGIVDFTALQMLITAVVGQVIAFAIYSLKSLKQNTKGGIVYDTAMLENQYNNQEEDQG